MTHITPATPRKATGGFSQEYVVTPVYGGFWQAALETWDWFRGERDWRLDHVGPLFHIEDDARAEARRLNLEHGLA